MNSWLVGTISYRNKFRIRKEHTDPNSVSFNTCLNEWFGKFMPDTDQVKVTRANDIRKPDESKWYPQTWPEQIISANLAYIRNVILGAIFQSPTCWHFTTTDTVNKFIGKLKGHWHRKIFFFMLDPVYRMFVEFSISAFFLHKIRKNRAIDGHLKLISTNCSSIANVRRLRKKVNWEFLGGLTSMSL